MSADTTIAAFREQLAGEAHTRAARRVLTASAHLARSSELTAVEGCELLNDLAAETACPQTWDWRSSRASAQALCGWTHEQLSRFEHAVEALGSGS
jgi:hypothetical protein